MALDLKQELEMLTDALGAAGVPFAICGGIAVTIYGAPRLTDDLDLLIQPADVSTTKQVAASVGFDVPAAPMIFSAGTPRARTIHRVSKLDGTGLLTLDLILVDGQLADVWKTRVTVEWESRRVPIVSREGLLAMKRLAGRPKASWTSPRSKGRATMKAEVDMSPDAIARRLAILAGLYRLARSLEHVRILGPVEPAKPGP